MKIVRGVTLHPQSLFTLKSLKNFQIGFRHKIKMANTKIVKLCNLTKIWVQNVNLRSEMERSKETL